MKIAIIGNHSPSLVSEISRVLAHNYAESGQDIIPVYFDTVELAQAYAFDHEQPIYIVGPKDFETSEENYDISKDLIHKISELKFDAEKLDWMIQSNKIYEESITLSLVRLRWEL